MRYLMLIWFFSPCKIIPEWLKDCGFTLQDPLASALEKQEKAAGGCEGVALLVVRGNGV